MRLRRGLIVLFVAALPVFSCEGRPPDDVRSDGRALAAASLSQLPDMPANVSDNGLVALRGGRALSFGGAVVSGDSFATTDAAFRIDVAAPTVYSPYAPLPLSVQGAFAFAVDDRFVVVAGGVHQDPGADGDMTDRTFATDPAASTPSWTELDRLPFPMTIIHEPLLSATTQPLPDGRVLCFPKGSLDASLNDIPINGFLGDRQSAPYAFIFTPRAGAIGGTWDLARRTNAPPVAVHGGTGSAIAIGYYLGPKLDDIAIPQVMKLTAASGHFTSDDEGQPVRIAAATSAANNSQPGQPDYLIYKVLSATEAVYWNPDAVAEPFTGAWSVGGRQPVSRTPRRAHLVPVQLADGRVLRAGGSLSEATDRDDFDLFDPRTGEFQLYDAPAQRLPAVSGTVVAQGFGGAVTVEALPDGPPPPVYDASTHAVLTQSGAFPPKAVGGYITIQGARAAANNGTFRIDAHFRGNKITYLNPNAVAGSLGGAWTLRDGEDPITATSSPRTSAIAVALDDGTALVGAGITVAGIDRVSYFTFDPTRLDRPWTRTGSANLRRHESKAFKLDDGTVFLAFGFDEAAFIPDPCGFVSWAQSELYDPRRGTWSFGAEAPVVPVKYDNGTYCSDIGPTDTVAGNAVRLATGQVLFTGGSDSRVLDQSFPQIPVAMLYTPASRR